MATVKAEKLISRGKFKLSGLDKIRTFSRLGRDPTFHLFFENDVTSEFLERCEELRTKSSQKELDHILLIVYGKTGSAKSYSALTFAKTMFPKFDVSKHLFFNLFDFKQKMADFEPGSVIFIDEESHMSGEGSGTITNEFNSLAKACRDYELSIICLSPNRWGFDAHWYIEAIPGYIDFENQHARLALQEGDSGSSSGSNTVGFIEVLHPSKVLGEEQLNIYRDMKKKAGARRMGVKGQSFYDDLTQKVLKYKHPDGGLFIDYLIEKYRDSNKGIPLKVLDGLVHLVFPNENFNVIHKRVVSMLKFKLEMGLLNRSNNGNKGDKKQKQLA